MLPSIDVNEAARYMGVRGEPDDQMLALLHWAEDQLKAVAKPRHMMVRIPLIMVDGVLYADGLALPGNDIKQHLNGCTEALFLAATLGAAVDQAIRTKALFHMGESLALNASAAALLEGVLNKVCRQEGERLAPKGLYLTPRFSPGYGDLPLDIQPAFLKLCQGRRIGLCVTDGCMLTPEKSVTAIMGITLKSQQSCVHTCSQCKNTTCPFRA